MSRVCACPRKESLEGMRSDAIWFSRACAVRWARENPGKSLYGARKSNVGRTKPAGRKASYRRALDKLRSRFEEVPSRFLLTRDQALAVAQEALRESLPGAEPTTVFPLEPAIAIRASNEKTQREAA